MPYYCTVPRCTSMAGKAKNVSFHQFPRDEELARLWNDILKRGKPYTKYSKVCSLHFKPEDYTITSVGKNKGQWRTLRKDAVPSQNLPSESPAPYSRKQWDAWSQGRAPVMDTTLQQQMAQAIYMQTMMAMQAAGTELPILQNGPKPELPNTSYNEDIKTKNDCTYRCTDCAKCFKDPDVFILHKRTHAKDKSEKENFNVNLTLRSNPILANLLKTDSYDPSIVSMENLLMTAIAANMDYLRNYSTIKEENFDGYDSRRDEYENREDYNDSRRRIEENERTNEELNRNGFNPDVNSYKSDCKSSDAIYDLNRLKSDLNRRSVEIHVKGDTSHANNYDQVTNDLTVPKDSSQVTESVDKCYKNHSEIHKSVTNRRANHNSVTNHSENYNSDANRSENHNSDTNRNENNDEGIYNTENDENEREDDGNCLDSRVNGYAMNFTSREEQIPYKASFYRESYLSKNASLSGNLLESNHSLQNEKFFANDENCSESVLNDSSSCDNDINESLDSNSLVIDESA